MFVIRNVTLYLSGILFSSFGAILFIKSNFGVGAGDSVAIGLSLHLLITIGTGMAIIHLTIISSNSLLSKKLPNIFIFIPVALRALTLDLCFFALKNIEIQNTFNRGVILISGLIFMGLGIGMYLHTKYPKMPVDDFMFTLKKLTNFSIRSNRVAFETSLLVIGYFLGGPIGIGTVINAFGLGPSIQFFYKLLGKKEKNSRTEIFTIDKI